MSHWLNCVQKQPPCFLGFGPLLHRISVTRECNTVLPTASTFLVWGMAGLGSKLSLKRGGTGSPAHGGEMEQGVGWWSMRGTGQ